MFALRIAAAAFAEWDIRHVPVTIHRRGLAEAVGCRRAFLGLACGHGG